MKFNDININDKTKTTLEKYGYIDMTPIQEKTIKPILNGKDIVGQAQTGTGKTAAFIIPILEKINKNSENTEHLIIAPTRELALQIVDEFRKIGEKYNLKIASIVGGMNISRQRKTLKDSPDVIIATPGRIIDHLERNRIDLMNLKTFVIDEVDEMFKSGFKEEIDKIITYLPGGKQTLLFSATVSNNVKNIANKTCDNPEYISVSSGVQTTKNVVQKYIIVKENDKFKTLLNLLETDKPNLAVVFGRTKRRSKELGIALSKCGFKADSIHGDLTQSERNNVMKKFKSNKLDILVATDVAARGIDVNGVTHIYNFDIPQEIELYVHRIGRTGRANTKGFATSLIRKSELGRIDRLEKETKSKIDELDRLNVNDMHNNVLTSISKSISKTNIDDNNKLIKKLLNTYSHDELISILIDTHKESSSTNITLTPEPPIRPDKNYNVQNRFVKKSRNGNNRNNRNQRNNRDNKKDNKSSNNFSKRKRTRNRDSKNRFKK